jgi:hypothetical protein
MAGSFGKAVSEFANRNPSAKCRHLRDWHSFARGRAPHGPKPKLDFAAQVNKGSWSKLFANALDKFRSIKRH